MFSLSVFATDVCRYELTKKVPESILTALLQTKNSIDVGNIYIEVQTVIGRSDENVQTLLEIFDNKDLLFKAEGNSLISTIKYGVEAETLLVLFNDPRVMSLITNVVDIKEKLAARAELEERLNLFCNVRNISTETKKGFVNHVVKDVFTMPDFIQDPHNFIRLYATINQEKGPVETLTIRYLWAEKEAEKVKYLASRAAVAHYFNGVLTVARPKAEMPPREKAPEPKQPSASSQPTSEFDAIANEFQEIAKAAQSVFGKFKDKLQETYKRELEASRKNDKKDK